MSCTGLKERKDRKREEGRKQKKKVNLIHILSCLIMNFVNRKPRLWEKVLVIKTQTQHPST